ncbi:hypothetical protein QAD02_006122 [Eretmocerus hayati]|uniref:Uncharacterized protein n=1 Tax=Eretmocerus hayati TaxID=131215 RepID=A0ACC2N040_9HYME|nr:hypothetical protein QAD02_006122 [Eretmocerus hayati]
MELKSYLFLICFLSTLNLVISNRFEISDERLGGRVWVRTGLKPRTEIGPILEYDFTVYKEEYRTIYMPSPWIFESVEIIYPKSTTINISYPPEKYKYTIELNSKNIPKEGLPNHGLSSDGLSYHVKIYLEALECKDGDDRCERIERMREFDREHDPHNTDI